MSIHPAPRKFAVGDKVRIVKKAAKDDFYWASSMDATVGLDGYATEIDGHGNAAVDTGEEVWWYPSSCLELVEGPVVETASVAIGDLIFAQNDGGHSFTFSAASPVHNKYSREVKPGVYVDVYDVLRAFNVTDPCLQHMLKKCLAVGCRGHKNTREDLVDILASAKRALEIYDEWEGSAK